MLIRATVHTIYDSDFVRTFSVTAAMELHPILEPWHITFTCNSSIILLFTRINFVTCCMYFQGYLFISVLVSANSELMKLVIQSIKNDLSSRNPIHICLALQCIANIGSKDMADAFCHDIPKLLVSG